MTLPSNYQELEKEEQLYHLNTLASTVYDIAEELAVLFRQHNIPEDLFYYAGDLIHESRGYALHLKLDFRKNRLDSSTYADMNKCLEYTKHIKILLELIQYRKDDPELPTGDIK